VRFETRAEEFVHHLWDGPVFRGVRVWLLSWVNRTAAKQGPGNASSRRPSGPMESPMRPSAHLGSSQICAKTGRRDDQPENLAKTMRRCGVRDLSEEVAPDHAH